MPGPRSVELEDSWDDETKEMNGEWPRPNESRAGAMGVGAVRAALAANLGSFLTPEQLNSLMQHVDAPDDTKQPADPFTPTDV